jgi:TorA maturation chaperone TorD
MSQLNDTTITRQPMSVDLALARSVLYEAAAIGLRVPTTENLERLKSSDATAVLVQAAQLLDAHAETETANPSLTAATRELVKQAKTVSLEDLNTDFQFVFGHTARGTVPPYETEYGTGAMFRQTEELSDLSAFYTAFGLKVPASRHERMDHFAIEFEFSAFMTRKHALHLEEDDRENGVVVEDAQRQFLRDHLARTGCAFASSLVDDSSRDFYVALGRFCGALLRVECGLLDVQAGPAYVPLRSTEEDETPMACGSCDLASGASNPEDAE